MDVRKTLLIIEDEKDFSDLLVEVLAEKFASITVASRFEKAQELLSEGQYHALVSDYLMPGPRLERFVKLFRQKLGAWAPFVVQTGEWGLKAEELYYCGVDYFLFKPFSLSRLATYLEKSVFHSNFPQTSFVLRDSFRSRCYRKIYYRFDSSVESGPKSKKYEARILNFSNLGAFLGTAMAPEFSGHEKIEIIADFNGKEDLVARGQVAWISILSRSGVPNGVGLSLKWLDEEFKESLKQSSLAEWSDSENSSTDTH